MYKKYGFFLVTALIAAALWWRTESVRSHEQPNAHADASESRRADQQSSQAPAAISTIVEPTHLLGAALSTQGAALDDQALATALLKGGKAAGRTATFDTSAVALRDLQRGQAVAIPLPGGGEVKGTVNLVQTSSDGSVRVGGSLADKQGTFSLGQSSRGVGGRILLRSQELAYVMTPSSAGRSQMHESALASVICFPLQKDSAKRESQPAAARPPRQAVVPPLQSLPASGSVLYLDFDGATVTDADWNGGVTINALASTLSNAEITDVWNRVKEDFAPFNINVTTVASDYTNAAVNRRMRVIITPTDEWYGDAAGGAAWLDSFAGKTFYDPVFSDDLPAWVFNTQVNSIADAISHELGHTLGLSHDGRTTPVEDYYEGHGSGAVSWAPIMGVGYDRTVVQWSKGEYPNANNAEDDLAIIAGIVGTPQSEGALFNNTGYLSDTVGDTRGAATAINVSSNSLSAAGLISSAADVDFYSFTLSVPKTLTLLANPPLSYQKQANLDMLVELQNNAGTVLATSSPDGSLGASITQTMPAGTYFVKVANAGHAVNGADYGYSTYGSIGSFTLNGTFAAAAAPAFTAHPSGQAIPAGANATFTVAANGTPAPTYQWQRLPAGSGVWANVGDVSVYSGTTTVTLTITSATVGHTGDQFRCVATNGAGSATSNAATLTVTAVNPVKPYADHNGDSKADLVWRNSGTNEHASWLMNGTAAGGTASYGLSAEWRIIKVTDLDGDGKSDFVWRNSTTGAIVLWQMNGTAIGTSTWIYDSGTDWTAEIFADFNGDGKSDILWHNSVNGQYAFWLMNGGTVASASGFSIAAGWSVAKAADFDGDGKTDLLWRNASTGGVVMWLQNGITTTSSAWIYDSGTDWSFQLFADFNGDGKTDILWHNTVTGQYAFWLMDGSTVASASGFSIAAGWSVTNAADFNGDGKSDLIWRNGTSGGMVMWLQNGTTTTSTAWIYDSGTDWEIKATKDFNGDGKSDILWHNTVNGLYAFWLMNGSATSSASGFSLPPGWELTD